MLVFFKSKVRPVALFYCQVLPKRSFGNCAMTFLFHEVLKAQNGKAVALTLSTYKFCSQVAAPCPALLYIPSDFHSLNLNDGDRKFIIFSGTVLMPRGTASTDEPHEALGSSEDLYYMVSVVVPQIDSSVVVKARMSQSIDLLSSVAYSQPMAMQEALEQQTSVEAEAISVS